MIKIRGQFVVLSVSRSSSFVKTSGPSPAGCGSRGDFDEITAIYVQVALLPLVAANVCLPGLDSR
jgi:hypothetical protein